MPMNMGEIGVIAPPHIQVSPDIEGGTLWFEWPAENTVRLCQTKTHDLPSPDSCFTEEYFHAYLAKD